MGKINLELLILEVLEREIHEDNLFLTAGEISFRCNGICFEKGIMRKSSIVPYSIKIRMPGVRQRAFDKKLVVTSKRVKHIEVKNKGKRVQSNSLEIYGWKIADKDDKEYIIEDMEIRQLMSNGNRLSMDQLAKTAKKEGLIAPEDIPAILKISE